MKKNFLFSMLAVLLAGFWFGGASFAECTTHICIGDVGYDSLSAAVDAEGNEAIVIQATASETYLALEDDLDLDLKGKTINLQASMWIEGTSNTVKFKNGKITTNTSNKTLGVDGYQKSGGRPSLILENIEYTHNISETVAGINVDNGGYLEIISGEYTSNNYVVVAWDGSEVLIKGGEFNSKNNFIVGTNGTAGEGNNIITINGGTFNGDTSAATDSADIVCGIHAANSDTISVNNATFNLKDGVGIVARGGTTTLGSGVIFNFTKDNKEFGTLGQVGDSRVVVPVGYEFVMDVSSNYPGAASTFKTINQLTGTYLIANDKDVPDHYTVKFADGQEQTLTLNKNGTTAAISEIEATEGYQWYNGDETIPYVFDSAITNNVTLTSRINTYTVKFDVNAEGVVNPTDENVNHGATVTEPQVTNTGYVLLGWFKDDDKYDFSTPVTASFTLTGKWEALSDSTGAVEDEDFTGVVLVPEEPALTASDETTIETAIASSNSTATMEGVVEVVVFTDNDENGKVGAGDVELTGKVNFTTARLVRIPVNTTGNVIVKVRHTGQSGFSYDGLSTSSGATCSGGNATPAYNGEGITPTSGYVEIYTCSASTFVAYTETANPAPRSSGGGGSSSYSCKNLPSNAVANNTTKPKKNTDYSYSTDTGAVCTFQCKTGYTWNEKDTKCEKATETVADTNDTTVTENTENADTSDSASTEDLQKVLDDGFTVEFHNAYEFAFKNGITTMPTIQEADMNGNLNRIAMAKMLSQYAINILGKTPDTTREVPNFPDVDAQLDADYNNGVTLAYQLGIMGINIDEFRPFDLVTRAEFGTALSRMLFGIADGTELYYETHMQKLLEEKIITVANPDMHELRGYVMIMLMRSANK